MESETVDLPNELICKILGFQMTLEEYYKARMVFIKDGVNIDNCITTLVNEVGIREIDYETVIRLRNCETLIGYVIRVNDFNSALQLLNHPKLRRYNIDLTNINPISIDIIRIANDTEDILGDGERYISFFDKDNHEYGRYNNGVFTLPEREGLRRVLVTTAFVKFLPIYAHNIVFDNLVTLGFTFPYLTMLGIIIDNASSGLSNRMFSFLYSSFKNKNITNYYIASKQELIQGVILDNFYDSYIMIISTLPSTISANPSLDGAHIKEFLPFLPGTNDIKFFLNIFSGLEIFTLFASDAKDYPEHLSFDNLLDIIEAKKLKVKIVNDLGDSYPGDAYFISLFGESTIFQEIVLIF